MICKSCKNKSICKHYEYFKNMNIEIHIDKCELFSNNSNATGQTLFKNQVPTFRQPLPSRPIDDDDDEDIVEDEEKVFVNIDDYNEPQSTSIIDLVMKGDLTDDQEKN